MFILDIVVQFRIVRLDHKNGVELATAKKIAKDYLTSFYSLIDILAITPIFTKLHGFHTVDLLSIFKVLRIFKMSLSIDLSEI